MPADLTLDRGLPQSIEAERSILGAMLLENSLLNQAVELLKSDDFYLANHRLIFEQMLGLSEKSRAIDLLTLTEELENAGHLETVGGRSFVSSLIDGVPKLSNLEYYARIVREKATLRRLIKRGHEIINSCYDQQDDVDQILDTAEKAIFDLAEEKIRTGFQPISEIAKQALQKIEIASKRKSMVTGVPTGYTKFDELTSGLQQADLVIIAARPSMGKTAFSLNIATYAAIVDKLKVGVFSLEMSSEQLLLRILCSEAHIDSQKLRTGKYLSKEEWTKITRTLGELSKAKLFIDDTAGISLLETRAKARRLKAEHGSGSPDCGLHAVDVGGKRALRKPAARNFYYFPGVEGSGERNEYSRGGTLPTQPCSGTKNRRSSSPTL